MWALFIILLVMATAYDMGWGELTLGELPAK